MDKHLDDQLSRLISDAVADVEPADRLVELRELTSSRRSRTGWYAAGGAMLAAAAAVTAIALAGNQGDRRAEEPSPVQSPSATATQEPSPTPPGGQGSPVPIYYMGETPQGPRLFRYFEPLRGEPDHGSATELAMLTSAPSDPDYWTLWPVGAFESAFADIDAGLITVILADGALRERPASMSEAEASVAIQQVVYTLQAEAGARLPVQFRFGGNPIDQVFGVPTSEPITHESPIKVLALVNITNPSEGRMVEGHFTAEGVANSYESTVPWQVLRDGDVVLEGFATAEGWMGERLFPWETQVDVSSLEPGTYTFRAMTSDPSDGEGPGAHQDTRTIVVQ